MEWWAWCLVLYLGVGVVVVGQHLSAGKMGTSGALVTLFVTVVLWPVVVFMGRR